MRGNLKKLGCLKNSKRKKKKLDARRNMKKRLLEKKLNVWKEKLKPQGSSRSNMKQKKQENIKNMKRLKLPGS